MNTRNRNELTGHEHSGGTRAPAGSFWKSGAGIALFAFLGIAGFLLLYEHRAHIPGGYWLLGGLLAVCVGMHFFMHGGHGGHGGGHRHDRPPDEGKG